MTFADLLVGARFTVRSTGAEYIKRSLGVYKGALGQAERILSPGEPAVDEQGAPLRYLISMRADTPVLTIDA